MAYRRDPEDFQGRLRDLEDAVSRLQRGPAGNIAITGAITLGNVQISAQTAEDGTVTLQAVRADLEGAIAVVLATLT